jgi:hypothetical protein
MRRTAFDLPSHEAAEALGISHRTLKGLRLAGVLKPGRHYIAVGAGVKAPRLRWNVEAVTEALAARTKDLGLGLGRGY